MNILIHWQIVILTGLPQKGQFNMMYYVPVILIVVVNSLYHVAAKGMPNTGSPFAPLLWTYLTAAALTTIMFFITSPSNDLVAQMKTTNIFPFMFGATLVGLEFGFILLYRVGWDISIGSTVCAIALAMVMLFIGVLFYKEHVSFYQLAGILFCAVGLFLLNKK